MLRDSNRLPRGRRDITEEELYITDLRRSITDGITLPYLLSILGEYFLLLIDISKQIKVVSKWIKSNNYSGKCKIETFFQLYWTTVYFWAPDYSYFELHVTPPPWVLKPGWFSHLACFRTTKFAFSRNNVNVFKMRLAGFNSDGSIAFHLLKQYTYFDYY